MKDILLNNSLFAMNLILAWDGRWTIWFSLLCVAIGMLYFTWTRENMKTWLAPPKDR